MEFKGIHETGILQFIGMSFYGDPFERASGWNEENEIGSLWKRFMGFFEKNPDSITNLKDNIGLCEIHFETEETCEKGYFEVFVGAGVEKLGHIPLCCVAKQLPETKYAVFTLRGEEIITDWGKRICSDWLPSSGYVYSYNYTMMYYDERFLGMDNIAQSSLDVYVPVKKL